MKPMVMAKTDAEFEAADQAVWTEMARRILKGAAPDSLDRTDEDGLVTRALYPVDAPDARAATAHVLPAIPHRRLVEGWQVCQPVGSDAANADIHEALGSGATALLMQFGAPTEIGQILDGVVLTAVGLGLGARRRLRHIIAPSSNAPKRRARQLTGLISMQGLTC